MAQKKPDADPKDSPVVPDVYDVRLRLRHLSQGILSQKDLQKHLETIPDDAANAEVLSFEKIVNGSDSGVNGSGQN